VSGLTTDEITAVTVVVVLAVVILGVLLYMLRRLRQRRDKLLGELHDRPQLVQDRAFNRLAMARREAEILSGQGIDVARPRELIAQAQAAFDLRDSDRAYQLAQQAHEGLVSARRDARLPSAPAPSAVPTGIVPPSAGNTPATQANLEPMTPPRTAISKNRAESQFQLRLLDRELTEARRNRPGSAATQEAAHIRAEAGVAFDRGDFTDAFRLALRGRRTLGALVEGLPIVRANEGGANGPPGSPVGTDASRTAEQVAGAERCVECGYPALPGDAFCRGCGSPRTPGTCPSCGLPRTPTDIFCARCGARF
jgi:hypothetical protein